MNMIPLESVHARIAETWHTISNAQIPIYLRLPRLSQNSQMPWLPLNCNRNKFFPNYPASENSIKVWLNRTINCWKKFSLGKKIIPPKFAHQFQSTGYWLAAVWSAILMRPNLMTTKFVVWQVQPWLIYIINWICMSKMHGFEFKSVKIVASLWWIQIWRVSSCTDMLPYVLPYPSRWCDGCSHPSTGPSEPRYGKRWYLEWNFQVSFLS